jgi:hypothetical protein
MITHITSVNLPELKNPHRKLDIEVAISWNVLEVRNNEPYVHELKVSLAHPKSFDVASDV